MTLSRKGAKDRTQGRKLHSIGTRAKTRVAPSDKAQVTLITKLKAHARDLEKKLETRTRELSRGAGAADRDRRGAADHLELARRVGAGV